MQRRSFLLTLACAAACAGAARADAPAPASHEGFYQGKTLEITVSSGAGDSYDVLSRMVGQYIGKYLPGNPSVIVRNMTGAGGIVAANYLYNLAPKDGTAIGMLDQSIYETQLFNTGGLRADVMKFNWIGRVISNNSVLFAWHTAPVKKIADAFDKELIVSATGRSSLIRWTVLKRLTGIKFKLITGHAGSSEAVLAMQRGELDAVSLPWTVFRVTHADWLRDKTVNLLLQSGLDRAADLPDLPRVIDLAKTDEQKQLLELFSQSEKVGRSLVAPPALPAERVAELRKAFDETLADPDFIKDVKNRELVLDPMPGEDLQKMIIKSFDYPPATIEKAQALIKID